MRWTQLELRACMLAEISQDFFDNLICQLLCLTSHCGEFCIWTCMTGYKVQLSQGLKPQGLKPQGLKPQGLKPQDHGQHTKYRWLMLIFRTEWSSAIRPILRFVVAWVNITAKNGASKTLSWTLSIPKKLLVAGVHWGLFLSNRSSKIQNGQFWAL